MWTLSINYKQSLRCNKTQSNDHDLSPEGLDLELLNEGEYVLFYALQKILSPEYVEDNGVEMDLLANLNLYTPKIFQYLVKYSENDILENFFSLVYTIIKVCENANRLQGGAIHDTCKVVSFFISDINKHESLIQNFSNENFENLIYVLWGHVKFVNPLVHSRFIGNVLKYFTDVDINQQKVEIFGCIIVNDHCAPEQTVERKTTLEALPIHMSIIFFIFVFTPPPRLLNRSIHFNLLAFS